MAKPRKLTPEQAAEARRRYEIYTANRPHTVAREMGISLRTLYSYVNKEHKERRRMGRLSASPMPKTLSAGAFRRC
jgi:DNA invertase Pin-like site-specific DNA recombinase